MKPKQIDKEIVDWCYNTQKPNVMCQYIGDDKVLLTNGYVGYILLKDKTFVDHGKISTTELASPYLKSDYAEEITPTGETVLADKLRLAIYTRQGNHDMKTYINTKLLKNFSKGFVLKQGKNDCCAPIQVWENDTVVGIVMPCRYNDNTKRGD